MTPSNSLAAVYGITADCAERRVLGPDVEIDIEVIDETNTDGGLVGNLEGSREGSPPRRRAGGRTRHRNELPIAD
jgi:hypothetical protein